MFKGILPSYWKELSFNETVRGRWTKRLLNEGGMRRSEEKTTPKAFLPSTGLQSFQDNILKAVVGNCVAVRAVSSYQWTSPRSRRTFRNESMKAQGKQDEGRCHSGGPWAAIPGSITSEKCCLRRSAYIDENFLAAGIPLRKIDHLRGLLEAGGHRLTKSSGMSKLIPTVHAIAKKDLLVDLGLAQPGAPGASAMPGHYNSVIFDGSTRQGEAIAIIVRFVNEKRLNWWKHENMTRKVVHFCIEKERK